MHRQHGRRPGEGEHERAYRLGGQDTVDPQFQEALEQLKRDPELARWFADEHALETRVQAKVKAAVKPPPSLKGSLLAQRKIVRPVAWWRQPPWLAAAAAIVVVATTLAMTGVADSILQIFETKQFAAVTVTPAFSGLLTSARAPGRDGARWEACLSGARDLLLVGPGGEDVKLEYLKVL